MEPKERSAAPVASATECTGLMPALPGDAAEGEALASLYAIHRAKRPMRYRRRR